MDRMRVSREAQKKNMTIFSSMQRIEKNVWLHGGGEGEGIRAQ
jgi:hypothetical protein